MSNPSDKLAAVTRMLQRGEAEGQNCPLHIGKPYRYVPTGKTCTYLGPNLPNLGPYSGAVKVVFEGEHQTRLATARSLDTVGPRKGGRRVA